MSIKLRWDDTDNNTLHQVFEAGWTLQAYQHSMEALDVMVNRHAKPVRVVMDMSAAPTPPLRLRRGRQLDEAKSTRNVERIVLIDPGHFMPQVNCPVDIVDTPAEARALLQMQPAELIPA